MPSKKSIKPHVTRLAFQQIGAHTLTYKIHVKISHALDLASNTQKGLQIQHQSVTIGATTCLSVNADPDLSFCNPQVGSISLGNNNNVWGDHGHQFDWLMTRVATHPVFNGPSLGFVRMLTRHVIEPVVGSGLWKVHLEVRGKVGDHSWFPKK